MVGTRFSKCLQRKSLSKIVLAVSAGRGVAKGTTPAASAPKSERLVEFTPDVVTFQNVPVGDTYTQAVRITNLAEGTLQIRKISTSNADFQVTGILLPVVVAHGTSENFTISFRPKGESR